VIIESQHVVMEACRSRMSTGSFTISYPISSVLPVGDSRFHASTCEPNGECTGIVVAAHVFHLLAIAIFTHRRAAKFATPD
jgi:hypothetical protein